MEAAEVGSESAADTSLAIAATATAGMDDTVMTDEPIFDISREITPAGTDPQPRVEYSTDLRKELSLDVLASLGGLAADDAKVVDEAILDLASVRADMDFISELSSLGPSTDHDASVAPASLLASSTSPPGEPKHGLGSAGPVTSSEISSPRSSSIVRISESCTPFGLEGLPGDDSSLVTLDPNSVKSLSSHTSEELFAEIPMTTSFQPVMNSASTGPDSLVGNIDLLSSVSSLKPSTEENPWVADVSAQLQSSRAGKEAIELASDGLPDSESAPASSLRSHLPSEDVTPVTPISVRDGNSATVEACHDSPKSSPSSPDASVVSAVYPSNPISVSLTLDSHSLDATDHLESALAKRAPLPLAPVPISVTTANPGLEFSPAPVAPFVFEIQSCTPCDADVNAPVTSLDSYSGELETLPFSPEDLRTSNFPIDNSTLASTCPPSSLAASSGDAVIGGPEAFPSPSAIGNVNFSNVSPAFNSTPTELVVSPSSNNADILDTSKTSSSPLHTSAVDTTGADIASGPFTPSVGAAKVPPFSDSVASPPLTARFWDVPSMSPGISLSVYFDGSRSSFRGRKNSKKKRSAEAGADLKDMKGKGLSDVGKLDEVAELESMLDSQKRMVKWQIDEVQRIATLQFQLTGSNPLSEQAMWDVLGVKGAGKKTGDTLSPESLKSLQEMFAIKDTLTKKEARDISFTYGASLTQVRDYFAGQRSLVRKLVQQAHDDAGRPGIKNASEQSQQIAVSNSISEVEKDVGFHKLSGPESVEKIIEVMRAEKGFAGQIQLLQIILHTDSAALILRRFLEKGALKMLGGWLVEAVAEQQTTVIAHLLKVLDHLPMSTAVSHQMPPLVHNVNKLRFHQTSAIAGRARSLLTKWVKLLSSKTQGKSSNSPGSKPLAGSATPPGGGVKRNRDPPAAQIVPGTRKKKVRAEEVLQQESKASQIVGSESPSLNGMPQGGSEYPSSSQLSVSAPPPQPKWSSTLQPSESAVAAVSVSRKRLASKSLGDQAKDRRKVMRVEDNHIGKTYGSKPATISKTSRPLSTDDIYKAKKLERLMQEPILKSKRKAAAAQEQSRAQDVAPEPNAAKKPLIPSAPDDIGFVKTETLGSSQGNWKGLRTPKPIQEEQPTATRTQLPIRGSEHHNSKTTITPTSSQDLLQTMVTPTSSQEQSVMGNLTEDTAYKRDTNFTALMEKEQLPSSLGRLGQQRSASSHFGGSVQLPVVGVGSGVNLATSDAAPSDLSHAVHSSPFYVSENNNMTASMMTSMPSVVDNVRISRSSTELSEGRPDEVPGLALLGRATNSSDKSALDATGSKAELGVGQENECGDVKPIPRETSLSDYYAVLRATMVRWRIPPEYHPDEQWNVAAGEDSKEREVQSGRVKREEEAYYPELAAVPDDPKDPWEEEPDYDDSLTLQIFVDIEQRKVSTELNDLSSISKSPVVNVVHYGPETSFGSDVSSSKMLSSAPSSNGGQEPAAEVVNKAPTMHGLDSVLQQLSTGGGGGTHDPDLLALLLRNPQLVSQLTSGQAFTPTSITNHPGVFMQPLDPLKQLSNGGNNGAGLIIPAGDLGQERLIPSNNSKALGIPLQPGRSVSSVDQTPPETVRVQDSIPMMPHPGMGQQQNMGFVPQRGVVDNRFLTPQMPSLVARNIGDPSGWEHLRVPPPPPPVPPTQPVINPVLQPPLPNQPNKQSNWHESQGWVGIGRPPLNPPQTRSGPEQLHTRQTIMTHNVRLPNYPGMVGVPQIDVGPETSVVSQPEVHHSQRPWLNGSHGGPTHENTMMHGGQDSGASRNNRWQRPPVRPTNQHLRSGNRDLADFSNGRQTSMVDNRSAWVQNERARAVLPPFQGAYALPPPPPYPAPLWQGQEGNIRLVQASAVNPFPHGRDLRPPQQQMWNNNMGSASRQGWRGQP